MSLDTIPVGDAVSIPLTFAIAWKIESIVILRCAENRGVISSKRILKPPHHATLLSVEKLETETYDPFPTRVVDVYGSPLAVVTCAGGGGEDPSRRANINSG